jgi:hypothetical protein
MRVSAHSVLAQARERSGAGIEEWALCVRATWQPPARLDGNEWRVVSPAGGGGDRQNEDCRRDTAMLLSGIDRSSGVPREFIHRSFLTRHMQ